MWRRSRCTLPLTIIKRLLKSWATPPVSWPMAWSCCAWCSAPSAISRRSASSCRCWVRRNANHNTANSNRVAGKLAEADAPRHAVDLGGDGEHVVGGPVVDSHAQPAVRTQALCAIVAQRIARQDGTVVAHQGVKAAARLADQRVEILEIFRPHRHRDDASE